MPAKQSRTKKAFYDVPQWQATTEKQQFHSLDFSQVRNTDSVLTEIHDYMGKHKNQASPSITEARCQGDMTTISPDEVSTVTLCFEAFISVQLKEPLIQSLESGRCGRSPYLTHSKLSRYTQLFSWVKRNIPPEDRLRIGALQSTGRDHIQTVDSFPWQSVRYVPGGSNKLNIQYYKCW